MWEKLDLTRLIDSRIMQIFSQFLTIIYTSNKSKGEKPAQFCRSKEISCSAYLLKLEINKWL